MPNFNDTYYEFYEWNREDSLTYIKKIPTIRINKLQMEIIHNNVINITKDELEKISNKTFTETGMIKYCLLLTDLEKVMVIKFNEQGISTEKSLLLLDEEESVIDECRDFELEVLDCEIIEKLDSVKFITRKESMIQECLLSEIKKLYKNKIYDEINYLYNELFNDNKNIHKKYQFLMDDITNNYSEKYNRLYNIIQLTHEQ